MGLLFGESTCATVEVLEAGAVIHVPREQLLHVIAADVELSEILLRTFALRRQSPKTAGGV